MRQFMDEDFLLRTPTARRLYHEVAARQPIIDFHCHLNPREIAENIRFRNIGHLMLGGDHYKWRAMAAFGVEERLTRGEGSDHDKFLAYARMMPYAIGNPLYHWTHLELRRVFGIEEPLNEQTAGDIWTRANALLATDDFRARRLIERFNVRALCTTDDPVDALKYHEQLAADPTFSVRVLPAFRPDKAVNIDREGFAAYIERLGACVGRTLRTTREIIDALDARVQYFHARGARLSDHALDVVPYAPPRLADADRALHAALQGQEPDPAGAAAYKTCLLVALAESYDKRGWAQQYHMNALRNNSFAGMQKYGPDTGFDSICDAPVALNLSALLREQDRRGALPKTILYTLNDAANAVLAAMTGNFQGGGVRGKMQFGSAWWFLDSDQGMRAQMKTLASIGLLSTFVGMLTDSRSFTSYPRHEYFRRILCDVLGEWVENGEYPDDFDTLAQIVRGVCYENARAYFDF